MKNKMTLSDIDKLFDENPEVKSNKAKRNLIATENPWLDKDEAGRLLGMWIAHRPVTRG